MNDDKRLGDLKNVFVEILKEYENHIKELNQVKSRLKQQFYEKITKIMDRILFITEFISGGSLALLIIMVLVGYHSTEVVITAIASIISAFASLMISVFRLPKILAEYLFDKDEDQLMRDIIKSIQDYDVNLLREKIKAEEAANERIHRENSVPADDIFEDLPCQEHNNGELPEDLSGSE